MDLFHSSSVKVSSSHAVTFFSKVLVAAEVRDDNDRGFLCSYIAQKVLYCVGVMRGV